MPQALCGRQLPRRARRYRLRIRRLARVALIVALPAALCACGGSYGDATEPAAPATSTATTQTGSVGPLEGASTEPVSGPVQTVTGPGGGTALLERVALGRHEGYDRVVFQFRNVLPGYRVEYVDTPPREDGSGAELEVDGSAFAFVRMEPASGFDLSVGEGELVYKGPRRVPGTDAGTSVVRELVRTGDFEGVLSWTVGLDQRVGFRVRTLSAPPRLVIDFRVW